MNGACLNDWEGCNNRKPFSMIKESKFSKQLTQALQVKRTVLALKMIPKTQGRASQQIRPAPCRRHGKRRWNRQEEQPLQVSYSFHARPVTVAVRMLTKRANWQTSGTCPMIHSSCL